MELARENRQDGNSRPAMMAACLWMPGNFLTPASPLKMVVLTVAHRMAAKSLMQEQTWTPVSRLMEA